MRKRTIYYIRDKADDLACEDADWLKDYQLRLACPKNRYHLGLKWRTRPRPIDVVLDHPPKGMVAGVLNADVNLIHKEVYAVLKPYARPLLIGKCGYTDDTASDYVSCVVAPDNEIDPYRGRDGLHDQCPICGAIENTSMSSVGIVERQLRDRLLHASEGGGLYADLELVESLKLRTKFPSLKFVRERVIPEPEDGDVLPGDPGWEGIFRPQVHKLKAFYDKFRELDRDAGRPEAEYPY